jgi:hypothetical protein
MNTAQIEILPKRGEWIVKINDAAYIGPYSYEAAMVTAIALADAAWQLGGQPSVILQDRKGERHTVWDHPALRHEIYA